MIGHSLGEAAAAVVAGALSLDDGVRVICRRSRLLSRISGAGAMASVELPAQTVRAELAARGVDDVQVSVIASPESCVVGGATHTIRDLVAAWESREVMAREVAVDVASHSPQVDSILAELTEVLAELTPMTPSVPYYSATLDDPRAAPAFDAGYWVDNLRQPVRFAAAVRAALDDGHRVFGEPTPHPLLTRAVEQTASAADIGVQALACMRREQPMPYGLRGFLADLYNVGAAVNFAALYPGGRLIDAPLPTWTHRQLLIKSDGHGGRAHGAGTAAVHPLLGEHVRLAEEPERHAWQGDVGTAALPWLADHQINEVPVFPGAAYCEMALAAARTLFGEQSEVRDISFEDLLLLDERTSVSAIASVEAPDVVDFVVETDEDGERARRAGAVLRAADDDQQPQSRDLPTLLAAHAQRVDGAALRQSFEKRGVQLGPAFTGLATAHIADGEVSTVLAEVGLPGAVRSQQTGYDVHPALLDACFQSVTAHPAIRDGADDGLLVPLGVHRLRRYGSARNTRYCYARVTAESGSALEADLDLLDEDRAVLLAVRGLRMGTGATESGDRVLADRLLTCYWQQHTLPPVPETAAGTGC